MFNFDLIQDIHDFLKQNPITRELDIIRYLQSKERLPKDVLSHDLSLFRTHFLVFNALYRLQKTGNESKKYALNISALAIHYDLFIEVNSSSKSTENHAVRQTDPLYLFYTDLTQLSQTTTHDVQKLLNQFWQRYIAPEDISDKEKTKALHVLELSDPVDFNTIKLQYRRLAMRHHPDRGGDQEKLVSINQAMQCLEVYYSR